MSTPNYYLLSVAGLGMALAFAPAVSAAPKSPGKASPVTGKYIEARSASVYAGACHYNGEVTTVGREAILAWKVARGTWNGQKLDGLIAIALVAGDDNLAFTTSARRSSLLLDARASRAQQAALASWVQSQAGPALGTVAHTAPAPITFKSDALLTTLQVGNLVTLSAKRYPCSHCLMPAQTWYQPFAPHTQVQVAQGTQTRFSDTTLQAAWSQTDADNCFVGTF